MFSGGSLHRSQQHTEDAPDEAAETAETAEEMGMRPGFFWRVGNGWNVNVLL